MVSDWRRVNTGLKARYCRGLRRRCRNFFFYNLYCRRYSFSVVGMVTIARWSCGRGLFKLNQSIRWENSTSMQKNTFCISFLNTTAAALPHVATVTIYSYPSKKCTWFLRGSCRPVSPLLGLPQSLCFFNSFWESGSLLKHSTCLVEYTVSMHMFIRNC